MRLYRSESRESREPRESSESFASFSCGLYVQNVREIFRVISCEFVVSVLCGVTGTTNSHEITRKERNTNTAADPCATSWLVSCLDVFPWASICHFSFFPVAHEL